MTTMKAKGYAHVDLSSDNVAKEHVRHMIGGAARAADEHIYEIAFPERPGALVDFLRAVGDNWNISLFHYRSAASDTGSVLIGFESPDRTRLETKLASAGFVFTRLDINTAVQLFAK
jgi:threonine dehydratase